ncbi:Asp-tRNA(Asn)/Glu-tRNA(Gln) amidotransferase subunit GatA [Aurantibacillus circumpalustris]|uniref:Asp-tRNA(Asn)/Glu-tRNA(Gln) amidotransferase subunit GatA n=1 Tax=Aurantibacillus circumpalustris TaxID=3036359 RepID=UPI00295AB9FC|nr:Asp-tRNA(Asn)/Glu-tRNA(Gln) amidotransferase subunit GatA [Aurantibacillus circumpalustris]
MYSFLSINKLQSDLKSGAVSCKTLVEELVSEIKKKKQLNAFLEVFEKSALVQAIVVDEKIKSGKQGKLAGVVVGLKDNICYKGHKVSASSKILEGFESLYSATVVERLLAEDAIIIGRLNCDEFAMGSSNENSAFGNVLNPLNEKCVPGGSSGGAAAAVAANLCHISLGSDTGGSIRQPASFTGTVGIKPTYGRVSRYGLIAYASSFDQIGPITKSVEDTALALEVICGLDPRDNTSSSEKVETFSKGLAADKKYKIAYLKECVNAEGLDPEVKSSILKQIEILKAAGHQLEEVSFPYLEYLVPTYYVLTTAEASSNLSRFSGIHYGHRTENATDLESTYKKSRSEGFGKEVKRRIMLGTFVLSAGYYDAYYSKGQKVRRIIQQKTKEIFKDFDFILTPSTPGTAFEFGKNSADPIKMYLEDIFTVQAPIAGIPAISVPCGTHSNGLPMGLQLMADYFEEEKLLNLASKIKPLA